jgi:hypothetical protein
MNHWFFRKPLMLGEETAHDPEGKQTATHGQQQICAIA